MRLGIAFHRFGPYHAARLSAAGGIGELTGIEYSSADNTYRWSRVEDIRNISREVCFPDADVDDKSFAEVSSRVRQVLERVGPEVMAVPGWSSPAAIATLAWCAERRIPAVVMSDSLRPDAPRPWKEWVKSRMVRMFSAALVAGTPHADYLAALGMPPDRVLVGYDAVDNAYFETRSDAARGNADVLRGRHLLPERYFLAPGRFIPEKNLVRLLEGYAIYASRAGPGSWKLVLLGDGPLLPAITRRIAELGIGDQVLLPGFIQYDDLPAYYGLASAAILASTSETWGLVVNEAMASGLPVLVSNRCGCAVDLVHEGGNGFTFDPRDVDQIATQMLRLSSGGIDLIAMGREGRKRIAAWGVETFARNLWSAARAALGARSPERGPLDRALLWATARR